MQVREIMLEEMRRVAAEHKRVLNADDDGTELLGLGLDSLCFAILVARLEDRLGIDPFATSDDGELPVTLGDLVRLYERAVA